MRKKEIYIIITNTPSIVSGIIAKFTHTPYNHVSVSLDAELEQMFSFGRRYKYIPWIGGFVQESPHFGTLGRFPQTEAIVLKMTVDASTYADISERLANMLEHKYAYRYDTLGLFAAIFGKTIKRENYYYCSEFVKELLIKFGIESTESFEGIVRPMDFLELPSTHVIYRGRLSEFPEQARNYA